MATLCTTQINFSNQGSGFSQLAFQAFTEATGTVTVSSGAFGAGTVYGMASYPTGDITISLGLSTIPSTGAIIYITVDPDSGDEVSASTGDGVAASAAISFPDEGEVLGIPCDNFSIASSSSK